LKHLWIIVGRRVYWLRLLLACVNARSHNAIVVAEREDQEKRELAGES
jgi:hypothetical protein